jgi:hypothetical protein
VLNMPGDERTLLYVMVRDEGFPGDRVTSQFYDPFYYLSITWPPATTTPNTLTLSVHCCSAGFQKRGCGSCSFPHLVH